jgi:surfactin synthase thioesterase subunit
MSSGSSSGRSWFPLLPRTDPDAIRLICMPYAGGGTPVFHPWRQHLPRWIQLVPVELPGRWGRIHEPPSPDLVALASATAEQIARLPRATSALFGYSYGALLAYEIANLLRERHGISICHLFVAARRAPHQRDQGPAKHLLGDDDFRETVETLYGGGFDPELLAHPDMAALLLRILRVDIQAVETYRYRPRPPLTCPILAFGGAADPTVALADLAEWRHLTIGPFSSRSYEGGHFFLRAAWREMLRVIEDALPQPRPPFPPALGSGNWRRDA